MAQQSSSFFGNVVISIGLLLVLLFIFDVTVGLGPSADKSTTTVTIDKANRFTTSETLIIEVPQKYDSEKYPDIHTFNWTGSNGQKWVIIWHLNEADILGTLNSKYDRYLRNENTPAGLGGLTRLTEGRPGHDTNLYDQQVIYEIALGIDKHRDRCPDNTSAWCIMEMVQEIPYHRDEVSIPYKEEFWKYPIETLKHGGDCEDQSILMAALLGTSGYDVSLARVKTDNQVYTLNTHIVTMINAQQVPITHHYGNVDNILHYGPDGKPELLLEATALRPPNCYKNISIPAGAKTPVLAEFPIYNGNFAPSMQQWPLLPLEESMASIDKILKPEITTPTSKRGVKTPAPTPTKVPYSTLYGPQTGESCQTLYETSKADAAFINYVLDMGGHDMILDNSFGCSISQAGMANTIINNAPMPQSDTMKGIRKLMFNAASHCQDPNSASTQRTWDDIQAYINRYTVYKNDIKACARMMDEEDAANKFT